MHGTRNCACCRAWGKLEKGAGSPSRSTASAPAATCSVTPKIWRGTDRVPGRDARHRTNHARGSLRRGRGTVGDLDLLVTSPAASEVLERFVRFPRVEVLARGENEQAPKWAARPAGGRACAAPRKLRRRPAMLHRQGPGVALRTRAVKMGFRLTANTASIAARMTPGWPARPKPGSMKHWACA